MKKQLLALLLALFSLFSHSSALAQSVQPSGPGWFIMNGTAGFTNPVDGETIIFDSSTNLLRVWNAAANAYVAVSAPLSKYDATTAPGPTNDVSQGFQIGSRWTDVTHKQHYICTSNTSGAAQWFNLTATFTTADWLPDFVVSGGVGSVPASSLTMTVPAATAYVGGLRVVQVASNSVTYPASSDTYDFLQSDGTWHHDAVSNGAAQPSDTGLLVEKVVSNGTQITAVTQIANSQPLLTVPNAITSSNPITLGQANSLYAPISLYASQPAGYFLASPEGSSGVPVARRIVASDLASASAGQLFGVDYVTGLLSGQSQVSGTGISIVHGSGTTTYSLNQNYGLTGFGAITGASVLTATSPSYNTVAPGATNITITLPLASTCGGKVFAIEQISGTGTVTFSPSGSDTIEGTGSGSAPTLIIGIPMTIVSDGVANWRTITPAYVPGTNITMSASKGQVTISASLPTAQTNRQGVRLYCVSGDPKNSADHTAVTSLFIGPCNGNQVVINGTPLTQTEKTLAVPATTNQLYDVFEPTNLTPVAVPWSSDSARATALVLNSNGDYERASDHALYVGSFRTTGVSGQTEDSKSRRLVVSYFNRLPASLYATDSSTSWTDSTTAWRAADANTTPGQGRVDFICPLSDSVVRDNYYCLMQSPSGANTAEIGIALDSTTAASTAASATAAGTNYNQCTVAQYVGFPAAGYHYLQSMETATTGLSQTFIQTLNSAVTTYQSGEIWR